MSVARGKYDDICTMVREETKAQTAVVVIGGGNLGDGFSVVVEACEDPEITRKNSLAIVGILRDVANRILADLNYNTLERKEGVQ